MRFILIGINGFVGSRLHEFLNGEITEVIGYSKSRLDFCNPATFENYRPLNDDIIIDCIARIDGNEADINAVNFTGLSGFIEYLNKLQVTYKYVYFSTYATCLKNLVDSNVYVRSKARAETFIKNNVTDYRIIRLIFPFGKGENKNRVVSRIINKIKAGETISVDKFRLNLTPFADIRNHFLELINSADREINFSNGIDLFFPDIVTFMFEQLGMEKKLAVTEKELTITVPAPLPGNFSEKAIYEELATMLHD